MKEIDGDNGIVFMGFRLLEALVETESMGVVSQENIQRIKKIYNWEEQEKVLLELYREM